MFDGMAARRGEAHAAPRTAHSALSRAGGYVRLLHPFPVAMNGVAAAAFATLAAGGQPGWRNLALIVAAIVGSQGTVGVVNDLRDRDLDAATKPHKPLVCGRARVAGAFVLGCMTLVVALAAGAMLGAVSLALVVAMTAAGLVYDLWLKRTALSFLPYVLGLPILPVWAWLSVRPAPPRLWLTYPLGVLIGFGLHLANALPDAERDAAGGVRGAVQALGRRAALALCLGAFAVTLLAVAVLTWGAWGSGVGFLLAAAALLGVAAVSGWVSPTPAVLQRNWGVLIVCALCIAAAWLRAL